MLAFPAHKSVSQESTWVAWQPHVNNILQQLQEVTSQQTSTLDFCTVFVRI